MRDTIAVRGLEVDCIIGVNPEERERSQPLVVDVELQLDTEAAGRSERLVQTIDYEFASAQIVFLLQSCRFGLLETAAHALYRYLLAPPPPDSCVPRPEALQLRLSKSCALGGRAVPSLSIERDAQSFNLASEQRPFGTVDVVFETAEAGIYRLNIAPDREIPLHVHKRMHESEMVIGCGLECQGLPAATGSVRRWPLNAPHYYKNPTQSHQSILCVDRPPFIESDEAAVSGKPADVRIEPDWRR